MFCPRCGTQAPDDAGQCTLCGLVLRPDAEGIVALPPAPTALPAPAPIVSLVTYGGFWRRFAACLVDATVLFFPSAIVRVLLGRAATSGFELDVPASWAALGFECVLDWMYAALLISSSARATLGQQVMDLHVTDLEGGRVSFARASLRWAAQILNLVTLGFGLLLQIFTPRRQALHDLVTGTVVVRPRRAVAPAAGPYAGPEPAAAPRFAP